MREAPGFRRTCRFSPARGKERGGIQMKKMSIRKAGTIRLTSAAYYCCSL
jgi:hypothetical protein